MALHQLSKHLKSFAVFATLALSVGLTAGCEPDAPSEVAYPVLNGEDVVFSQLLGKVVFINYWADWCRPCRVEIPELNAFAEQYQDEVRVLSVNFDGVHGARLAKQVKSLDIRFDTLLVDPRAMFGATASGALPETLVIDRTGVLFSVLIGPQTSDSLKEILQNVP